MSRLTIKNSDGSYSQPTHTTFEKMFYKLSALEDVLEEFGIESVQELKARLQSESQLTKAGYELALENEELTKQLSKAIVPKFESQDIAYRINNITNEIEQCLICCGQIQLGVYPRIIYNIAVSCCDRPIGELSPKEIMSEIDSFTTQELEENLFATQAEAQAKLDEIRRK